MMKFFGNIKFRLTLWYLLMVAALVALFGAVGYCALANGLSQNLVTPYDMRMAEIADLPDGAGLVTGFTSVSGQLGAEKGYTVGQLPVSKLLPTASENGTIEIRTLGGKPILVDRALLTASGAPVAQTWVYIFMSNTDPADRKLVVAAESQSALASTLGVFKRTMLISAGVTLLLAAVLGFFLIWLYLRPLRAIALALQRIGGADPGPKLKVRQNDELGELAATVNQTFDRVDNTLEAERQVTCDLSHELRTPLAIAQAQASLALTRGRSDGEYQQALETVSKEITHLSSVTNRLLFLARSENGAGLVTERLNLRKLLDELASDAAALCEGKGIVFYHELSSDPCSTVGDPVRLRELFLNLLDNAVRYTPSGGTVSLHFCRRGDCATVAVTDTGVGINATDMPSLFKRFFRADKSHAPSGSGLGLSISQRIAQLHGGGIQVQSQPGHGSTFTVTLPLTNGLVPEESS